MTDIYTIYGGGMWREVFNGLVTILGTDSFTTLLRIVSMFGVLGVLISFMKSRNPLVFLQYLAVFMIITSVLLVPKRSVQIIDITDPAGVYEVDNVPAGIAMIAGLSTAGGFDMAQLYDEALARPDSLTYTKTGMLFGSNVVAQTSDFRTENPQLSALLPQYVENCVIGDILLNHKYTVYDLLHSSDPLTLITRQPSPLRGLYEDTGNGRMFVTCQQAASTIQDLVSRDAVPGSSTVHSLATKLFGNKANADSLLLNAMNESYGFFYAGGLTASQIMRNNITNAAVRDGWKGFESRSSDTANLVTLATESSLTKQRLSWASTGVIVGRALPLMQSLMMLILIGLFPLVIALSLVNHSIFGLNTLKMYAGGFLYFQMWPVMYAILNSLMNYYLQTKTGSTALVLSNSDQVALQQSDAAALAGYLSASIPVMSFFLTKGAGSVASQVVGGILSSSAFTTSGQASTAADGNWSFNNMSMDNVSGNKFDTNLVERSGQQSFQTGSGAMHTQTADGHNVYDTSGAISNLPVNLRLSSLASSGFSEQSRQAQQQAQTALDGYNHSVTSGFQQMHQLTSQTGNSDTLTQGSDSSVASNITRGAMQMQSAAEGYAKANHISEQQAFNVLNDISNQGSSNIGARGYAKVDSESSALGKLGSVAFGVSGGGEMSVGGELRHTSGDSHGTQNSHSSGNDFRHDKNSQFVRDFRQGVDMVNSARISESGSHADNQSNSEAAQFAATMNDAKSQYHQYTDSTTRSQEFSRMANLARNESASLDANYNQEFVDWASKKYGSDAQNVLTHVTSAEGAATEFMKERLEPEIMQNYAASTAQANSQQLSSSGGSAGGGQGTQEHNLFASPGAPSQEIKDDYRHNIERINSQADKADIASNIGNKVSEKYAENSGKIGQIGAEINKNKTTVQASSDILNSDHQKAQAGFAEGYLKEESNQSLFKGEPDNAEISRKLHEMRKRFGTQ
ncbi:conjugal transfer mating-pair stabilization protein TraG [Pantoea ananatis]|uniref:conjugal transfer mating-pair stabilization protein TraG n=1 Tax=Pantoea ananas TaxID=553 RepID=UPI001B315A87|nr:conjugal transfer mating-pair stabilization protein TraG [Pantoea ananatis]